MRQIIVVVFIFIVPLVITSFLSVWQRNEIIRVGYEIETLQQKKNLLRRDQKEYLARVERLSTLERIEKIALEQLKMQQPEPEQRVFITLKSLGKKLND